MNNNQWIIADLREVASEVIDRFGSEDADCPVYGVDRSVGLTPVPKYMAKNLSRYKRLRPGMFAYNPMRLNIGSIGYCSHKYGAGLVSPDYVVFKCDSSRLNPEFLNCYIRSAAWQDWTKGSGVGSVRMRIYFRELGRMAILLPPIDQQRAIAQILCTLDEKIDLNLQLNKTLEEMARNFFAQFLSDGSIEQRLGNICSIFDGPHATPKTIDQGPVFLGISNLSDGQIDLRNTRHITETDYKKWTRRVTPTYQDIVFSYETRLGQAAWVPRGLRCCLGRRMGLLRAKLECVHPIILLHAFLASDFQETIRTRTISGSTVDRLPLIEMPTFPIRLPSTACHTHLISLLLPIRDRITLNLDMNRTLSELRDTLLPKLISGEIRVKAGERLVGAHV